MSANKRLQVDELEVGMYVAELDRPWIETPFLFQGFQIQDSNDLDELKSHCNYVFVSPESLPADWKSRCPPPDASNDSNIDPFGNATRHQRSSVDKEREIEAAFRQDTVVYKDKTTLKDETRVAANVHRNTIAAVQAVMQDLKESGNLEVAKLEAAVQPMVDSVLRNPAALACLVRMQEKDAYLYHHSLASSVWATILGRQIGLGRDDLDVLALGAMLLDVGKTRLPDEIVAKPGKLEADEFTLMRSHVTIGLEILDKSGAVDQRVYDMVAHHHERHNGSGYPAGLEGNNIPVFGRIAGIIDAYDAMISKRPYAQPVSSYDALRKLRNLADVEFQAEIIDQFTKAIGAFPTGTLVELNSGEVAIVTKQNRIRRLRPEVMIIMDANKELLDGFRVIDLNDEPVVEESEEALWIECGLAPGHYGIDPTEFFLD